MRIWLDLANSPHPLLFAPVARRLDALGHEVLVTARDNAQTAALARERWPEIEVIGGESPSGRGGKLKEISGRARALRRWARHKRADVAVSHNSYAQILAARASGIPVVTAMDFEHQPANHLAFRLAHRILLPEAVPPQLVRRQGASAGKIVRYPGFKEELYLGDFAPQPDVLAPLGLTSRPGVLAVVRTPPSRAIYHGSGNPEFTPVVQAVCSSQDAACVVLARHSEQRDAIARLGLPNCVLPSHTVDSRALLYESDLMIGAGGTMTREAALLGIPAWTMFAGRTPAVDLELERRGLMRRLTHAHDLMPLSPRSSPAASLRDLRDRGEAIRQVFVRVIIEASGRR